jgi:predicted ABC-type ATPase
LRWYSINTKNKLKAEKPTLIVIAGPNGSGKTSITSRLLKHDWINNCIYINPDEIAQNEFGDWNLKENVLKAAQYATELRYQCLEKNESLIFETVFSSDEKIDFIIKAKEAGYFIRFFFVCTSHPAINASRIVRRVLEGGHDVPIPKIINRYYKSISNCCVIANLVDRLYIYDNSVDFDNAALLFRVSESKIVKKYTELTPDWVIPILNSLKI